ncbi:MAG: hypothetical protein ACRDWA_18030 [Acidimicrobiia bacterium]
MRKLRDLVSSQHVRPGLMAEGRWIEVCDAMDAVDDLAGQTLDVHVKQRAAINRLQVGLSIEATGWSGIVTIQEHESSVLAAVEAVVVELGDRVNRIKAPFDGKSAAADLAKIDYHVGKISEATRALRGGSGGTALGPPNIATVRRALQSTGEAIRRRGYEDPLVDTYLRDAEFILATAETVLASANDPEAIQTADLPASFALPTLVRRVREFAQSLDEEFRETDDGWDIGSSIV